MVFVKAGITVTSENRKQLDKVIHDLVHVDYKGCLKTWRVVKVRLVDEAGFIQDFKTAWGQTAVILNLFLAYAFVFVACLAYCLNPDAEKRIGELACLHV